MSQGEAPDAPTKPTKPPPPPHPRFSLHAETSDFDFTQNRNVAKPTNIFESIFHLIKGCLGGGIMGVHEAYDKAGVWVALFSSFVFGFYISNCVWVLVSNAQILYKRLHVTGLSYPDVAEAALHMGPFVKCRKLSKAFRYYVDIIICIDLFGSCCVYELMMAKTLIQLIYTIKGNKGNILHYDLNEIRIFVAAIIIPVILLCMIRSLKYLAPFSFVANIFIVICVGATVYYAMKARTIKFKDITIFKNIRGYFEFAGVVIFSMGGIGVALPIENNMKRPDRFHIVLIGGYTIVVIFVSTVGFFGAWGFMGKVQAPVTLNFPPDIFPSILKALMGLMIYVTFALNFWAPLNLVWYYLAKKHSPDKYWIWERVYRTAFVLVISIIAIIFPNIGNLMGLLGAFCLSNMCFIFPAFIEMCVKWETPGLGRFKWILWKDILIMLGGVIVLISSTYFNVVGLIKSVGK